MPVERRQGSWRQAARTASQRDDIVCSCRGVASPAAAAIEIVAEANRVAAIVTPEDAIENAAVVRPWNASWLIQQHLLDGSPVIVGEFVAHDSILQFWSLNHGDLAECNALARPPLRRFRAEADVNRLTIPLKSLKMTHNGRGEDSDNSI